MARDKTDHVNKKIGILGGTFDPPHIGHLNISKIAIKKFKLDILLWIVTKQNPLKKKPLLKTKIRILLSKDITKSYKKIYVKFFDKKVNFLDLSSNISFSGAKLVFFNIGFSSLIILPLGIAIINFDIIYNFTFC